MLSEKLTFSLTSLVIMLVFGLAVYVPSAMADHGAFGLSLSAAENMIDVSSADGMQIASGRDRASRNIDARATDARFITLLLKSDQIVNLAGPELGVTDADLTARASVLDVTDIKIDAYDAKGRALGVLENTAETTAVVTLSHRDSANPGREFLIRIDEAELTNAYTNVRAGGAPFEIHTLLFSIPADVMERADIGYVTKERNDPAHAESMNKKVDVFRVDLVDNDEGEAKHNMSVGATAVGEGVPGVVAIQPLRERSGFIEAGPTFTVRVILTEEPKDGLTPALVKATNADESQTKVVKGATLKGANTLTPAQASELTVEMAGWTTMAGTAAAAVTDLPEATGRDNMYHQYFVTVAPNPGFDGYVTISIKQFSDKVLPVANMYTPLSDSQIVATTLVTAEETVRDARVMNETLMVRVHTIADSKVEAAKVAYEARQKTVLDVALNETVIPGKLFIPAGGFLVLARGKDQAASGVRSVPDKLKDRRLTAAQEKYRVKYEFKLNAPADDLDNFFRNGGTLNLAYADIPEATGSGHGDSKGATGDDTTDYTAASTNTYAAGDLIINEIMWGLDGAGMDSQYIELHNTTAAAISIDNKEWIITVGAPPTGYTVIDTAGNTPATGYWAVPGNSGVTVVSETHPAIIDLVSMSRVMDGTDGTAEASWAASISAAQGGNVANLIGRRIGTPGAANSYATVPPPPPPPAPEPEPMSPVATGADIMISEIMIDSNDGRLPQWIELANASAGEVSLAGWSIEIDNDAADADVVAETARLNIGDVTVGKDQVVLVVTKTSTRNSGVGMGKGDLREDRIVDVQMQVSPTDGRYSLISEMAFKIALIPPQTGGAVERGDVVGNLGMGWEIPMSEGNRSSIIRNDKDTDAGTDAADWVLASSTDLDGAYRTTYYGDDEDEGTPGYDAGGALPVELSTFSAKRDRVTGQAVITWETQSELNNAGFFIKRSQQRNGQFVVVNPTMIAGAGTTSEKQSYTYTDTTAKPNIVYYYQIEDVSLDGNRQTLTRGHRLKGHIGAAGKATTTWGELKTSREQ